MASAGDVVRVHTSRQRQAGFVYRPIPGDANAYALAIPARQRMPGFRYGLIKGETDLYTEVLTSKQTTASSSHRTASLLVV